MQLTVTKNEGRCRTLGAIEVTVLGIPYPNYDTYFASVLILKFA